LKNNSKNNDVSPDDENAIIKNQNEENPKEKESKTLKDEYIGIKINPTYGIYTFCGKLFFICLNLIVLLLFLSIVILSFSILIFIVLHIFYIININIHFNILDINLTTYFDEIEDKFDCVFVNILISYILLIFILGDISRYIIMDQISSAYKSLDILIYNTKYPDAPKTDFEGIFLIIIAAILFELFLKLFICGHNEYINLAYLITGTLFSCAIFLFVVKNKKC